MPHPNADRLVLCRLNDGTEEFTVLTGAPNLYEYRAKARWRSPSRWLTRAKARGCMTATSPGMS